MIGGLLDQLVFGSLERAVLDMIDGGGGSGEEQVGLGGGPGGLGGQSGGGGDGRSYDEKREDVVMGQCNGGGGRDG